MGAHLGQSLADLSFEGPGGRSTETRSAFSAGAHLGRTYQFGNLVAGVELDVTGLGSGGALDPVSAFGQGYTGGARLAWVATGRIRLGYAFDHLLVYGTAGLATGRVEATVASPSLSFSSDTFEVGTVWGGGVEWQMAPSLSLRLEALRTDLGATRIGPGTIDIGETTVRAGLTFHLR